MLHINQLETEQSIVVTLFEKQTLTDPFFVFVFTHVSTRAEVKFVLPASSDVSSTPSRYNEFEIDATDKFVGAPVGQYQYKIYESEDGETNGELLEQGKAELTNTALQVTGYEPAATTYSGYGG